MKTMTFICTSLITLLAGMVIANVAAAQAPTAKYHHYKLISPGTFGGPDNYIDGGDILSPYSGPAQDVNNQGTFVGWADTPELDPYRFSGNAIGNFCFNGDCYVSHAFQWQNGFKSDLGALPGGLNSASSWISASGLIAGTSQNGETDPLDPGFPEDQAVIWWNGRIVNLGPLPEGGYESGAESVNDRGQVVGWALNTTPDANSMDLLSNLYNYYEPALYPYQTRAFLWENGAMKDLGTLGTGNDAYAMAINQTGQVIGISYTNSTPNQVTTPCSIGPAPTEDPFLWENGKMTDLGTLGGTCGIPNWINNWGEVVGSSDLAGDQIQHAFLWTKATGMRDLGTLGGSEANTSMISDFGVVVGGSLLEGDSQLDAYLWNGTMHDLGALDGCSYAFAINVEGQVVGNWGGAQCAEGAFLWQDGGPMVDLNSLVSSNSSLSVAGAIGINDLGEITGSAADVNGNLYAILLIPCDENHFGLEGCDYSYVDANELAAARAKGTAQQSGASATAHRSPAEIRARFRFLTPNYRDRARSLPQP